MDDDKTLIEKAKEFVSENKKFVAVIGTILTFTIGSSVGSSKQRKIDKKGQDEVTKFANEAIKNLDMAYKDGMIDGMTKFTNNPK